jgi:hypothetical protein
LECRDPAVQAPDLVDLDAQLAVQRVGHVGDLVQLSQVGLQLGGQVQLRPREEAAAGSAPPVGQ